MKKGFIIGLVIGLTIASASFVLANSQIQAILNNQIKVKLNGQVQVFKDETTGEIQYPITYHNRTYLPLRNVAQLAGLSVDYDANTNTAILASQNKDIKVDNFDDYVWREDYCNIIRSTSDTWEYDAETNFDFIYLNSDDVPELVIGSEFTSVLIYSYNIENKCVELLATCRTGVRGATKITYVERENIIINQTSSVLFEPEYEHKNGCIDAFRWWGGITDFDTGWEDGWSQTIYVFDENDDSKNLVEEDMSKEVKGYLEKEKSLDLKYNKEEAQREVFNL